MRGKISGSLQGLQGFMGIVQRLSEVALQDQLRRQKPRDRSTAERSHAWET